MVSRRAAPCRTTHFLTAGACCGSPHADAASPRSRLFPDIAKLLRSGPQNNRRPARSSFPEGRPNRARTMSPSMTEETPTETVETDVAAVADETTDNGEDEGSDLSAAIA